MSAVKSVITTGFEGTIVDIECGLSNNLPLIVIVGFANKAVGEAKERIRGAFASSKLQLPRKRITINLAPADIPKADIGFDLAIAASIILASQNSSKPQIPSIYIGELALDGHVRPVRGIIGKLVSARQQGLKRCFIPEGNLDQAKLVSDIQLFPIKNIQQLYEHLVNLAPIAPLESAGIKKLRLSNAIQNKAATQITDIVGQAHAKRALEIAAAGGHNLFLSGPPGTGKSMLAKSLISIMPSMTEEEILEATHLHSLASNKYDQLVTKRPFRSPHHSASHASVVGGGNNLRPGEISLAHRGILLFDEMPEFNRNTLEALRQPLEDKTINISRLKDSADYPANFIFIATANPCPCGFYGINTKCSCAPPQIMRYQQKMSGPILDRIDLYSNVSEVNHERLLNKELVQDRSITDIKARVNKARALQHTRFKSKIKLNSDMTNQDIKIHTRLESSALEALNTAAAKLDISARSYMRAIKVARTIADLNNSKTIQVQHITEALAYRRPLKNEF